MTRDDDLIGLTRIAGTLGHMEITQLRVLLDTAGIKPHNMPGGWTGITRGDLYRMLPLHKGLFE